MGECTSMIKRFLGGGTAFCLIASSILNPANFKVRAGTLEDITAEANITQTGTGIVKLEKVTGENGEVSYQLTATPGAGQKLKGITVDGAEVTGTVAAGGAYTLEGYGQTKVAQKVYFGKNPNYYTDGEHFYEIIDEDRYNELKGYGYFTEGTIGGADTLMYIGGDGEEECYIYGAGVQANAAQGWWIAGYQASGYGTNKDEGALVLLCDPDQPMSNSQQFYSDRENDHDYSEEWGCVYDEDEQPITSTPIVSLDQAVTIEEVHPNHYGGSDIRKTLQGYITDSNGEPVTDRFSAAEQGLMKETTVRTHDSKNDVYYSTTDKLYLGGSDIMPSSSAYVMELPEREDLLQMLYMTVGVNDNLKVALASREFLDRLEQVGNYDALLDNGPEGSPYITGNKWFWLRSPGASNSNDALDANTGHYVHTTLSTIAIGASPLAR